MAKGHLKCRLHCAAASRMGIGRITAHVLVAAIAPASGPGAATAIARAGPVAGQARAVWTRQLARSESSSNDRDMVGIPGAGPGVGARPDGLTLSLWDGWGEQPTAGRAEGRAGYAARGCGAAMSRHVSLLLLWARCCMCYFMSSRCSAH